MKKLLLAAALASTAIGGIAFATQGGVRGPMRADTNGDGIVSRSEYFTGAEARFTKRDANGDRKLSGDEMKDRGGRFARQDTNNDGTLSFGEAAARTAAQFQRLDADKDGKLVPEELGPRGHRGPHGPDGAGMMQRPEGPRGGLGQGRGMMIERLDTNKDGRISRDEMRAQADERFARLDGNKDGFIDKAEMAAPRAPAPPPPPAPEGDDE